MNLYAPHHAYGGPDGLKRLVGSAHARGLAVLLDVVYNHLGPEGNYLGEYGPYFTDRYKTPWGLALNFDGLYFATGIAYALTGAGADNDTTALTAADILGLNVVFA